MDEKEDIYYLLIVVFQVLEVSNLRSYSSNVEIQLMD